jgi:membrane protease subunit HflC
MKILKSYSLMALLALILMASFSIFTVYETQRAIVLRLGKMVEESPGKPLVFLPGLNFKLPMVDTVRFFDMRLQTIIISSSRIVTSEKKDVLVDLFVKWRINDFPTFFTKTSGDLSRAEMLLRQKIVDGVRAEFGRRTIREVVSGERNEIMQSLLKDAAESAKGLGIEVVDTRIKRLDLPEEVSGSVYSRMRSERQRIAEEHRAKGQSKANILRAQADAAVTILLAEAEGAARVIQGEGDAIAAKIYADAYSKDPDFYRFYRSLSAYQTTFSSKDDILVLKPDGAFFQYFKDAVKK